MRRWIRCRVEATWEFVLSSAFKVADDMHNTASGKRGWKKNQPGHPAGTFSCILITWGNSNFSLFSTSGRQLQHIRSLSVRLWSCLHCQCHMGSRQTSSGPPLKPTTAACLRGFLARPHPAKSRLLPANLENKKRRRVDQRCRIESYRHLKRAINL